MKRKHPTDPNLLRCAKCCQFKERKEYFSDPSNIHGLSSYCKPCHMAKAKKLKKKESYKKHQSEYMKEYRISHPDRGRRSGEKRETRLARRKRQSAELDNVYIKKLLRRSGLDTRDASLLELYRMKISSLRTLTSFRNWRKQHESNNVNVYGKQCADEKNHEGDV